VGTIPTESLTAAMDGSACTPVHVQLTAGTSILTTKNTYQHKRTFIFFILAPRGLTAPVEPLPASPRGVHLCLARKREELGGKP